MFFDACTTALPNSDLPDSMPLTMTSKKLLLSLLLGIGAIAGCAGSSTNAAPPSSGTTLSMENGGETTDNTSESNTATDSDSPANRPRTLEELCETAPCRKNLRVDLLKSDGTRFTKTYPMMAPAVQHRLITIFAGETVLVEATVSKERPVDFKFVEKVTHPERTFSFNLKQVEEDGKDFMMLTSKNPFGHDIRLHLSMMLLSGDQIVKTSSCPVSAGLQTFEIWPDALFQILVHDIVFLEASDDHSCIE